MIRYPLIVVALIGSFGAPVFGQIPSLRSRVEALGNDYSTELRIQYPVPEFDGLVQDAHTIVVATIKYGEPLLTYYDTMLQTKYYATVQQVIRSSGALKQGDEIVFQRIGGATKISGFNVTITDPDFPPFNSGDTYVLMLTQTQGEEFPILKYGGQSAFLITPERRVRQASLRAGSWNRQYGEVTIEAFVSNVRAVLGGAQR